MGGVQESLWRCLANAHTDQKPIIQSRWEGTITSWVTGLWQLCGEGGPPPPPDTPPLVSECPCTEGGVCYCVTAVMAPLSPSPLPPAQISTSLPLTTTCCPLKPVNKRGSLCIWRRNLVQCLKSVDLWVIDKFWEIIRSLQIKALNNEKGMGSTHDGHQKRQREKKQQHLQKEIQKEGKISLWTHFLCDWQVTFRKWCSNRST